MIDHCLLGRLAAPALGFCCRRIGRALWHHGLVLLSAGSWRSPSPWIRGPGRKPRNPELQRPELIVPDQSHVGRSSCTEVVPTPPRDGCIQPERSVPATVTTSQQITDRPDSSPTAKRPVSTEPRPRLILHRSWVTRTYIKRIVIFLPGSSPGRYRKVSRRLCSVAFARPPGDDDQPSDGGLGRASVDLLARSAPIENQVPGFSFR